MDFKAGGWFMTPLGATTGGLKLPLRVGGSDEAFRSESRGKNVVRDGNIDENG